MRARLVDLSLSFSGKQRLTLELDADFREDYDQLHDSAVEVTVKKYRKGRSLDSNAYAWTLIDKLAQRTRLSKAEVYRNAIRSIGGVSETVCVVDKAVDRLCQGWSRNGLGWQTETFPSKIEGCTNVTLYYGSSAYDTEQMSALIDSLVQECRAVGIETMPPEQLESLIRSYK